MITYYIGDEMKKRMIILTSIVLVGIIITGLVGSFVFDISNYNLGVVTRISLKEKQTDRVELNIKYLLASGGYSVRTVRENEGEYCGDGMVEYDGELGKYRIMVEFGDVALKKSFADKMDKDGIIHLAEDMCARVAMPSDHGFVLYVGCDKPINVETKKGIKLNSLGGTIKIPIAIENE